MTEFKHSTPIFILGNPKSGTTVISSLLSMATSQTLTSDFVRTINHPTLQLELNFKLLSFADFINMYSDEFSNQVIKESFLTFYIPQLLQYFPQAKFVFIVRNPLQNIRSILNRLKIPGNLQDIDLFAWDELIKTPVWRIALQSEVLGLNSHNYIDSMAKRWNVGAEHYLQNKERFILVKYEDFLEDKQAFICRLAGQLGLSCDNDVSHFLDVQFQPKGDSQVDLKTFFDSKNYQIIHKVCQQSMQRLGYAEID